MTDPDPAALGTVLDQEHAAAEDLLRTLEAEYRALRVSDHAALEQAVDAKHTCISHMEALARQRTGLLDPDQGSDARMEDVLERIDAGGRLSERWNSLLAAAQRCQRQNRINGRIVEAGRHHLEQILSIVRGAEPAGYGPAATPDNRRGVYTETKA